MADKKPLQEMSWGELHHGAFLSEGRAVAFPLGFPGGSIPIAGDESHITALDLAPNGDVYGGTSGRAAHVFAAYFRGATGAVFDFGPIPDADQCVAVCCSERRCIALVNGPNGGRILGHDIQGAPGVDLLQEWGFNRRPYEEMGTIGDGERLIHAVADRKRRHLIGASEKALFLYDFGLNSFDVLGAIPGRGQIVQAPFGQSYYGLDDGPALWCYDLHRNRIERNALPLPKGDWDDLFLRWAYDANSKILYTADRKGRLFSYGTEGKFSDSLGQLPLAPLTSATVTHDGRLFGTCGEEMEHLFVYNPKSRELRDLGIAVSTIERRRYGYTFGDAVTGLDGEMYFGERDDIGHLWMYFPRIEGENNQEELLLKALGDA